MPKIEGIGFSFSKTTQAAVSFFCLGYWFIWNIPTKFIPKLAFPAFWLIHKIETVLNVPLELCSDCSGQWLALLMLFTLSAIAAKLATPFIIKHLSWSPLFLIVGQLLIYGSAKMGGHQFHSFLLNPSTNIKEVLFWHQLSSYKIVVISLGLIQVIIALGLLVKPSTLVPKLLSIFVFSTILILDIVNGVSVITHSSVLLLVSIYLLFNRHARRTSKAGAILFSLALVSLLIECVLLLDL